MKECSKFKSSKKVHYSSPQAFTNIIFQLALINKSKIDITTEIRVLISAYNLNKFKSILKCMVLYAKEFIYIREYWKFSFWFCFYFQNWLWRVISNGTINCRNDQTICENILGDCDSASISGQTCAFWQSIVWIWSNYSAIYWLLLSWFKILSINKTHDCSSLGISSVVCSRTM